MQIRIMKQTKLHLLVFSGLFALNIQAQPSYHTFGGIHADHPSGSYGFFTAKNNNHFTQNAYYDGGWKSYGPSSTWGAASIIQTNTPGGYAMMVYIDQTISAANEPISGNHILALTNDGRLGLGTTPTQNLHVVGDDTKILVEGSTSGAISLQQKDFDNSPIFEWQSYNGRIRLNYIDDLVTRADIMNISDIGNVGVGTMPNPDEKLAVNGKISSKEIQVEIAPGAGPDYVFKEDYDLRSLEEVQSHIDRNGHLPEVPSAMEMESEGVELGEMNMLLLKKIEELTLYQLQLLEILKSQQERLEALESK